MVGAAGRDPALARNFLLVTHCFPRQYECVSLQVKLKKASFHFIPPSARVPYFSHWSDCTGTAIGLPNDEELIQFEASPNPGA